MTSVDHGNESLGARFARHYSDLIRLAVPVTLSRAGFVVMNAVDAVILGRWNAVDLAHFGLGQSLCNTLVAALLGLLMGASTLTSHALGAADEKGCGAVFRRALPYALVVGVVAAVFCQFGAFLLPLLGQSSEMTAGTTPVLAVLGLGFPGIATHLAAGSFLEGLKRPTAGMVVMFAGNLLNAGLCFVLTRGTFGFPAGGALGAAWAMTISRTAMGLVILAVVWRMPDARRLGVRDGFRGAFREGRELRRFGYAAGLSMAIENGAFAALGVMAGMISAQAMAAFTIFLNLLALPSMASSGIATATAVRVGVGLGARDRREMNWAGWSGVSMVVVFLAPVVALYASLPDAAAGMYTVDASLLAELTPIVLLSAAIVPADGTQVVAACALRGRNDCWLPTASYFVSYVGVMLPVSWGLAFPAGFGLEGVAGGILTAGVVSTCTLITRLTWIGSALPPDGDG